MLTGNEYQKQTSESNFYEKSSKKIAGNAHSDITKILNLQYLALGISGEAGEVSEKVKKLVRDREGEVSEKFSLAVSEELGDIMWYVARLADELGMSLEQIMRGNIAKLRDRAARGVLEGSGDNR